MVKPIKQEAQKVGEKVKGFAADHPKVTVTGAVMVGTAVAVGVATTKVGMLLIAVTGVVAAAGVGAGVGRILGEALVRQSLEYIPPVASGSTSA